MTSHDPLCMSVEAWAENGEDPADCPECYLIDKVRTDERDTATSVAAEMMNRAWTNLRAEMEALPTYVREPDEREFVILSDVLALFDGGE